MEKQVLLIKNGGDSMVVFLVLAIILLGVFVCVDNPKCPECGTRMEGPSEDFKDGVWHDIYYCPHCRKEWF